MNKLIAIFASFFLVSTANAQSNTPSPTERSGSTNYGSTEKIAYFDGLAGYGTGSNSFNGFTWGATVGSKLTENFGWDVYFSSTQEEFLPGTSTTVMPLVADFNFFVPAAGTSLYIGPRAGVGFVKTEVGSASTTNTEFAAGAQVGSDFFLADSFSLGLNVNWTHVFADLDDIDLFNFVVPVKVWF